MPEDQNILDEIRKLASEGKDVASSEEFAKLKESLHERHDEMQSLQSDLKGDAEANKAFNKIQIAKEAFDFATGRDNARKVQASLDEQNIGLKKQKKHNQGAKTAREVMLQQNKIIIEQLNALEGTVASQGKAAQTVDAELAKSQTEITKTTSQTLSNKSLDKDTIGRRVPGLTPLEGPLAMSTGETLKIGGEDITRTDRARDEKGRYEKEVEGSVTNKERQAQFTGDASKVETLADDIRTAQGTIGTTRNKDQFLASKGAAKLSKNIGANAAEVQAAMEGNDEAKQQLAKVTAAMGKVQQGKGDRTEIYKEIEKLKLVGGDSVKGLDLDSVMKETKATGVGDMVSSGVKGFFGVNKGTDLFSKKAVGEAFSADRFFGKAGTGGKFSLAKKTPFMGSSQFVEEATRELEVGRQMDGAEGALGQKGLGLADPNTAGGMGSKKGEWLDKWIPDQNKASVAVEKATEDAKETSKEVNVKGPVKQKEKDLRTGQSVEPTAVKQLETLIEIRDILDGIAEEGGMGGGDGGSDMPMMMGNRKGKKGGKKGGRKGGKKGKIKGLMKGASKFGGAAARGLGGAARFIPGIGLAVAGVTAGIGAFNEFGKTDEFGVEGKDATLGMKAASATGGALSALTFGLADADSISKGIYGKTQDQTLQELAEKDPELAARIQKRVDQGENIDDVMKDEDANIKEAGVDDRGIFGKAFDYSPVGLIKNAYEDATTTTDLEAGMDAAKDSGLYDENFFGESKLDASKLKEASINQLKAIIKDDDLSNEDMQLVKDTLEAKRAGQIEDIAKADGENLENQVAKADIETSTSPTGTAIENMSRIGNEADAITNTPAPVVVNNTSPSAPAPSDNKFAVAVSSPGIRNKDHTLHRFNDRRFFG